jgi:tetratricopeptide (TPR) repeat protein
MSAELLRRHILALGATAAFGAAVKGLGEFLDIPGLVPVSTPLPSRVFPVHVAQVRDLTQLLGQLGKMHGPDPSVSSAAAASATRLLKVPGVEPIKQALMAAVAELHIHAGWAASDAGLYHRAMIHYARALELASDAGDAYLPAHALTLAGFATVEHGHPDDGLKMQQLAQIKAWQIPAEDPRGVAVQAWAKADSATAYAALGDDQAAYRELTTARELWQPSPKDPTAGHHSRPGRGGRRLADGPPRHHRNKQDQLYAHPETTRTTGQRTARATRQRRQGTSPDGSTGGLHAGVADLSRWVTTDHPWVQNQVRLPTQRCR